MKIVADALLPVVLQKFDSAVHHDGRAGDVKSDISRCTADIPRHTFRSGISNAINYR